MKKTGNAWKYLAVKDAFLANSQNYVFTLQVGLWLFVILFLIEKLKICEIKCFCCTVSRPTIMVICVFFVRPFECVILYVKIVTPSRNVKLSKAPSPATSLPLSSLWNLKLS